MSERWDVEQPEEPYDVSELFGLLAFLAEHTE